jgi:probable HAF family extracellular repeat protein
VVSTLASSSVSLAAGASQTVNVTVGNPSFATLGGVPLQVVGASLGNPAVTSLASATIVVPSSLGVTAAFVPPSQSNPGVGAGPVVFALNVNNTGTAEDGYSATITGTSGAVQASLVGLSGSPTQSIPKFLLPGVTGGEIFLNVTPSGSQGGTVTVQIMSLSNPNETATATATLTGGAVAGGTKCDVNSDGATNVLDAQLMVNEALGTSKAANDLSGDGVVNVVDLQIDINAILGLGCEAGTSLGAGASLPTAPMAHLAAPHPTTAGGSGPAVAIVDIGTLGGPITRAYGIDSAGDVVGESDTGQAQSGDTVFHAFLWREGRMTDLGALLGSSEHQSAAYGINDLGQAAGSYRLPGSQIASFLYSGDAATALSNVTNGQAKAINQAGQIVGDFPVGSEAHAFLWSAGSATDLGPAAHASALNDAGQVVGFAQLNGSSAWHAFQHTGSGFTDLGTLGGTNSAALAIDGAGEIVGISQVAGNGARHAFLYSGAWMSDLGTLGGDSQANGINSSGQIVGWSTTPGGQRHAVLWISGRMVDLNTLSGLDVVLEEATAINDFGQVVVNGVNGHAYRIDLRGLLP